MKRVVRKLMVLCAISSAMVKAQEVLPNLSDGAVEPESASAFDLKTQEAGKRLHLRVLGSLSQVSSDGLSLIVGGATVEADYAFFPKWALNIGVAQSLTFEETLSSLLTSIYMHGRYAIWGTLFEKQTLHLFGDQSYFKSTHVNESLFSVSLGLEQHFINATTSVVPASGVGLGLLYERRIWGITSSLGVKYSYLAFQGKTLSIYSGLLGFNWFF